MDHNMVFSYNYVKQKKGGGKNKCTSVAGHFDGHASAVEQYRRHRLIWHVQGYPGSHWMPSLLLLAPYRPSGHQGNSKQNDDENIHLLCWPF
jgi:hypothetical protein